MCWRLYIRTDIPIPYTGEVVVRMKARLINPSARLPILGVYPHRISLPTVPYEGVGVVEDIGSSVSPWIVGRRILALRGEVPWREDSFAPP